jgi:hypothetical protein
MPVKFHLNSDLRQSKWAEIVEQLPHEIDRLPPSARILGGRNALFRIDAAGLSCAAKVFENNGPWKKAAYKLSTSKAYRSYHNSLSLISAGVSSPRPVAWREDWDGPWLSKSYYLCERAEVDHDATEPSLHDDSALSREKLKLLALAMAAMHEANLLHLDLNRGNWLYTRDRPGQSALQLIDNNRLRRRKVSPERGARCFLQLDFPHSTVATLVSLYAEARNSDPSICMSSYLRSHSIHRLNRRFRDATRPWRKRIGL